MKHKPWLVGGLARPSAGEEIGHRAATALEARGAAIGRAGCSTGAEEQPEAPEQLDRVATAAASASGASRDEGAQRMWSRSVVR